MNLSFLHDPANISGWTSSMTQPTPLAFYEHFSWAVLAQPVLQRSYIYDKYNVLSIVVLSWLYVYTHLICYAGHSFCSNPINYRVVKHWIHLLAIQVLAAIPFHAKAQVHWESHSPGPKEEIKDRVRFGYLTFPENRDNPDTRESYRHEPGMQPMCGLRV